MFRERPPHIIPDTGSVWRCAVCATPVNRVNPDLGPVCRCIMEQTLFRDGVEVEMPVYRGASHKGVVVGDLVFIDGDPHADVRWSTGNVTRVSTSFLKTVQR